MCSCGCIHVCMRHMMENKLKMRWLAHLLRVLFLCVCVKLIYSGYFLLQTHANEIEWERMTSIQAQTASSLSLPLSQHCYANCLSLSVSPFFTSSFFPHPPILSLSLPPSHTHTHTWLHSAIRKCTQPIHTRVPLKACEQRRREREGERERAPRHNAPTPRGRFSPTIAPTLVDLL